MATRTWTVSGNHEARQKMLTTEPLQGEIEQNSVRLKGPAEKVGS
jgi:hypothetical protein